MVYTVRKGSSESRNFFPKFRDENSNDVGIREMRKKKELSLKCPKNGIKK